MCGALAVASVGAVLAAPAVAKAPAPAPSGPATSAGAGAGQPVCTAAGRDTLELSGLVATDTGYIAINDSNDAAAERVFKLDNQCRVTSSLTYSPGDARDPEDVAVASDGAIWVADIGDNDSERSTVGFWKFVSNRSPVLHRVSYPDGARDAEAILLGSDGVPIIISKEVGRPAGVYVPTAPLAANSQNGVPLRRAGEIKLPSSTTPNGIGPAGRLVITGGATAPDGKRVTLRTYADALEWDVPDGDVVKAITTGKPRVTPLPNEPQGEAITYSRDGKSYVTVSDLPQGRTAALLRYTPAAAPPPAVSNTAVAGGGGGGSSGGASSLTLDDITYLVAAVGLLGLVLVLVGVLAIRRSRRDRRRAAAAARAAGGGQGPGGPGGAGGPGARGRRPPDAPGGPGVTGAVAVGSGSGAGAGAGSGAGAGAASTTGRVTGSAAPRRNMFDDDGDGFSGPPARRDDRGAVYGGAPPPEPPTPGGGIRAGGGRANTTGSVYGARRDPAADQRSWPDDPDPFDYDAPPRGRR